MTTTGAHRAATLADADDILELMLTIDRHEIGEGNTTREEVIVDLENPACYYQLVEAPDGQLEAFSWFEHPPSSEKCWGGIGVRPGGDFAVVPSLFDWVRSRAIDVAPGLPLFMFCDAKNRELCDFYEAAGGEVVRRFYRMAVTFTDSPPLAVPELAPGVEIRGVSDTDADLRTIHRVIDTAFMDHFAHEPEPYDQWLTQVARGIASDLSLWWLAYVDGEPMAGMVCNLLPAAGYVDTLGTLREGRGKGLARALLLTGFAEFHRRGLRKAVLGVDATNPTGALELYQSVGMAPDREGNRYLIPTT